jgi:hypothetical protein
VFRHSSRPLLPEEERHRSIRSGTFRNTRL